MKTNMRDIPSITGKVLSDMELDVERKKLEEEKKQELDILRQKVIKVLNLPKKAIEKKEDTI
jgi:hypothetical protein